METIAWTEEEEKEEKEEEEREVGQQLGEWMHCAAMGWGE